MTDQQAAREIYKTATALRQYIKEQSQAEDPIILNAVQTIQANAIQLGAFSDGWLDAYQPAPDVGEEEERFSPAFMARWERAEWRKTSRR